jgi:hypothetical protein
MAKEPSVNALDEHTEGFEVTPEEEAELLEAIREADRGDVIPAAELLERLRDRPSGAGGPVLPPGPRS